MECNDGKHGALYCNVRGKWFCLVCGEEVDIEKVNNNRRNKNEDEVEVCD